MEPAAACESPSLPSPTAADTAVLDALRRLVQLVHVTSRTAERTVGVSGAQLFVLQTLAQHGPQTPAELATRTTTHQSSVSVVVRRLVEQGLAARTPSRTDRRSVQISVTPQGHALLDHAPPTAAQSVLAGLSRMPPSDRDALAQHLGQLIRALDLDHDAPPLFLSPPARPR